MKTLRIIRMIIAVMFFAATVTFFLTADYRHTESIESLRLHNSLSIVEEAQVIPSALAFCMGATLFWLCATFFMGRIYCSTVCPIGTFSDFFMRLRRELAKLFPKKIKGYFRFKEAVRWRYHIMALYLICLVIGVMVVPFVLEPWNIVRNVVSSFDPESVASTWSTLSAGMLVGIIAGGVMLLGIAVWGFFAGRDYCNKVCPVGQIMAVIDHFALLHIEFNPDKCISCMRCEDICRGSCISVKQRRVDNSRCVKCLDCICKCPSGALKLQSNRNRASTPLAEGVK